MPSPVSRARHTSAVRVGHVVIGGNAPIVVQSMTNTDTADIAATVKQVRELSQAGSELVRITVNTEEAAAAVPVIAAQLQLAGENIPLVGDFHFNGHKLLEKYPDCARALAKYRINPGNFISTATSCWRNIRTAPGHWPNTASTPATLAAEKNVTNSLPA